MKAIQEILQLSTAYLAEREIPNARREAENLLAGALQLKRIDLYMQFDRPLTESELERCRSWLVRRGKREPLAYIEQVVDFLDCRLVVDSSVLIPRQETEILAEQIIGQLKDSQNKEGRELWDLCTGSGCLGIALKKNLTDWNVTLSDVSAEALAVAAKNASANHVSVTLLQGDLLEPFVGLKADVVICNPPYVTEDEYAGLDPEVRLFEPKKALVGGESGLDFYRRLASDLPSYLRPQAKVFLEIGAHQGEDLLKIFNSSIWTSKRVKKDWAGLDRFFFLEFQ